MLVLKVTYRVPAHHQQAYEQLFRDRGLPLFQELGLKLKSFWRTLVGSAGEYLELWEFDTASDFERLWRALLEDPRFHELLKTTGPMVQDETLVLLVPVFPSPEPRNDQID